LTAIPDTSRPLANRGIVVTRPRHQSGPLIALIEAAGGRAIAFPVIEIAPFEDARLQVLIDRLHEFHIAIFVSANAALFGMRAITARRALPTTLACAAVGRATQRELERCGAAAVVAPSRYDSEALLELPELNDVAGRNIVIFRAQGGRELLADTLAARGAHVEIAQCYVRRRADTDACMLLESWTRGAVDAVTATSSESVRNLCALIGERGVDLLKRAPLFVTHPRIAENARSLGLAQVVATGQGDQGLVDGMVQWFKHPPAASDIYSSHATD
jgi:uroporphyrinogen-III synthase